MKWQTNLLRPGKGAFGFDVPAGGEVIVGKPGGSAVLKNETVQTIYSWISKSIIHAS